MCWGARGSGSGGGGLDGGGGVRSAGHGEGAKDERP